VFDNYYKQINRPDTKKSNLNFDKKDIINKNNDFNIGDEITSINSNLSKLSYEHFSKSISKGVKKIYAF
jgi:hypothetical protein